MIALRRSARATAVRRAGLVTAAALALGACAGSAGTGPGSSAHVSPSPPSPVASSPTSSPRPSAQPRPAASQTRPTPGFEETPRPAGLPLASLRVRATAAYRFDAVQDGATTAIAWSPCRPVHYVVRLRDQPSWGAASLRSAFAELHRTTGLRFVDDGVTAESVRTLTNLFQPTTYGDRWAPVVITWSRPSESKVLVGAVAGVTNVFWWQAGDRPASLVSAMVQLDAPDLVRIARVSGTARAHGVILHELGHLVGLGHVKDKRQNMYPVVSARNARYAAGDLAGLRLLGQGPCNPDV